MGRLIGGGVWVGEGCGVCVVWGLGGGVWVVVGGWGCGVGGGGWVGGGLRSETGVRGLWGEFSPTGVSAGEF